jgi:hypothetical protein
MSVRSFFKNMEAPHVPGQWGSPVEKERRRRMMASLAAFAYEFRSEIIMSDHDFDKLCLEIDPSIDTGHPIMDKFFREKFDPSTGMWVRDHPELQKLEAQYERTREYLIRPT